MLEYFGAHRPFLTTVPGLPERLALQSGGGFAPDAPALARELIRWSRMTLGERSESGEESFMFGLARFGLAAVVDRLEELLGQAMAEGAKPGRGSAERIPR